MNKVKLEMS